MRVPFADLRRETAAVRDELDAAAARVLDRGWYVLGAEGEEFEAEFAAWLGARHCAGVANGTDAIELAVRALGIGPGAEVVTQANTCVPTVAGIERTGARVVLCDVEPDAGTIDLTSAQAAMSERTKAIVAVHLYGQMGDVAPLVGLGVPVIEDCAQAHGARHDDHPAGTIGVLGAFSFYPTKNLGALGDAGAVVTNEPALDEQVRLLRQYGQATRYEHVAEGVNSRLDELQAAFLRVKLAALDADNDRRREIAAVYDEALGTSARLTPLAALPGRVHARHLYVARAADRAAVQEELDARGIQTLVHYPRAIHQHPPYADRARVPLSNAEALAASVLSLPLHPRMTDDEVGHVAQSLRQVQ
jgi:dTDP-3-amino-3,4,6-trideoxy-alpha-D-glucose transaminase